MSLPLPASLSPSKVATFRDCALAFRYSSIDGLPETPTPAAAKGTLVHRALELLHTRIPAGERTPDVAAALVRAEAESLLAHPEYGAVAAALAADTGAEGREAFVADAEQLVRNCFLLEDPNTVAAVGVEVMLAAEVGEHLRLRGIIDRLDLTPEGLVVTDYKTGRAPSEAYERRQLAGVHFYSYLCEQAIGVRPVRVQLLHLREPVAITVEPSDQSTRGLTMRAEAVWDAVERGCEQDDFRPQPGFACGWCSYHAYCPAQGGDLALGRAAAAEVAEERAARRAAREAQERPEDAGIAS